MYRNYIPTFKLTASNNYLSQRAQETEECYFILSGPCYFWSCPDNHVRSPMHMHNSNPDPPSAQLPRASLGQCLLSGDKERCAVLPTCPKLVCSSQIYHTL